MDKYYTGICLLFITLFASCQNKQDDEKAVKAAFENYRSAILADRGEEAVQYVDSGTIEYYGAVLHYVRSADSVGVDSLSLLDRLIIFSIRHRATREEIRSFDAKGLLVHAVNRGMIGKSSVEANTIGEVSVDGDFASGQLMADGKKSLVYEFHKESGSWKIGLTSAFPVAERGLRSMIMRTGMAENEYIFQLLELQSGIRPGKEIWKPAGR